MSTSLIDTYVSEVGRRLPRTTRSDIEAEIRSILQDMLEERSQKTGKPVDEEMTLDVLKSYGAPEKVAATYLGDRYLIGPRLYPIFILVVRIVLTVIGVLAVIGLGIALFQTTLTPINALQTTFKSFGNLLTSLVSAFGNIVIIFAIIEWALYRADGKAEIKGLPIEKEWDPRSLTKIAPLNRVKMGETILEIVGSFVAIVLFNFYPQFIGFTPSLNSLVESGNWAVGFSNLNFVPLLSEAFFSFVPYLTILWVLTIILDIVLLRMSYWNAWTRIASISLKVINIIIAAAMLGVPSLLAVTTASLTSALGDADTARILMSLLNQVVRVGLWISIIGNAFEIVRAVIRLARNNRIPQFIGGN